MSSNMNYYELPKFLSEEKHAEILALAESVENWTPYTSTVSGKRNTALSYPLSDNYAPCSFKDETFDGVMLLNTQARHAVFNNDSTRYSINISFKEDINEAIDIFKGLEDYELKTS